MEEEVFETQGEEPPVGLQEGTGGLSSERRAGAGEVENASVEEEGKDAVAAFQVFAGHSFETVSRRDLSFPGATSTHGEYSTQQRKTGDPIDRYFRLKAELQDLQSDIQSLAAAGSGVGDAADRAVRPSEVWNRLGGEVTTMQRDLEALGDQAPMKTLLDGRPPSVEPAGLAEDLMKMLDHLADGTSTGSDSQQLADMERRLAALERFVGQKPSASDLAGHEMLGKSSSATSLSLIDSVRVLEDRLRRFDPDEVGNSREALDTLQRSMSRFLDQRKKLTEDDGKHQRELQALFQRTQMMDEFGGELPALVTRLRTLQELHEQAIQCVNRLSLVEQNQIRTDQTIQNDRRVIETLENSLAENMTVFKGDIQAIDERIAALAAKVE